MALYWIAHGHGYEITGADVIAAYDAAITACKAGGSDPSVIASEVTELMNSTAINATFLRKVLASRAQK